MGNWQDVILGPAGTVWTQVREFILNVFLVVVILIIGWVIAKVIKALLTKALRIVRLDDLSDRIELDSILEKGGMKLTLSELIGEIVYWIVVLITVAIALNAVQLTVAADLLSRIVAYIPNIVVGIFIIILGMFVATLLNNIVQTAASNAGLAQSRLLGNIAQTVVIVFAIAITLEQLGIGAKIIELTVSIVLGSIGLAVGLAFGLGCKDMAAKTMSEIVDKLKKK